MFNYNNATPASPPEYSPGLGPNDINFNNVYVPPPRLDNQFDEVNAFLECLFEMDDIVEIRTFPIARSEWTRSCLLAQTLLEGLDHQNRNEQQNVHIGLNPRSCRRGRSIDVKIAHCLFADWDHQTVEQVEAIITSTGLPEPTLLVNSGHGIHGYWRLLKPLTDLDLWRDAQKLLATKAGSDPVVCDPPRCTRLPGFYNMKAQPVPCVILRRDPSAKHRLESLVDLTSRQPDIEIPPARPAITLPCVPGVSRLSRMTQEFLTQGARQGERNQRLFNAACDMAGCGFAKADAVEKLTEPARNCGLKADEINRTIDSAYAQPRTPSRAAADRSDPTADSRGDGGDPNGSSTCSGGPATASGGQGGTSGTGGSLPVQGQPRPVVANVRDVGRSCIYRRLPDIARDVHEAMSDWPCVAMGGLFALRDTQSPLPDVDVIHWLTDHAKLFAWLGTKCDIRWTQREAEDPVSREPRTPATKEEFFAFLSHCSPKSYAGIELLPHVPPLPKTFYVPVTLPPVPSPQEYPGGRTPLRELLDRFNADTPMDRELFLAALLTPGWGGAPGSRPALIAESQHGRGVGKTLSFQTIAGIWGGEISIGASEDRDQVVTRLLSEGALGQRCVLLDNLKGTLDDQATLHRLPLAGDCQHVASSHLF